LSLQANATLQTSSPCHSERSEESRLFNKLRSFTSFRMTRKRGFAMGLLSYFKKLKA
jgi:hypothetical protein